MNSKLVALLLVALATLTCVLAQQEPEGAEDDVTSGPRALAKRGVFGYGGFGGYGFGGPYYGHGVGFAPYGGYGHHGGFPYGGPYGRGFGFGYGPYPYGGYH